METMKELNPEELEGVTGGNDDGGFERKPRAKNGCDVYKIVHGDTLTSIAKAHNTSVNRLLTLNPQIKNRSFIISGHYIYVPN